MKKEKVIRIGKKKYLWKFENMDARLVTAIGILGISIVAYFLYMFVYVLIFFGSAW